jgi:hypothetical protein
VVWRDRHVEWGGKQNRGTTILPEGDPGADIARRWRKRLCTNGKVDDEKIKRDGVVVPSQKMGKQKKSDGITEPKSQKEAKLLDV